MKCLGKKCLELKFFVTDTVDFTRSSDEQKKKLLKEIIFQQFNLLGNRTGVIKKTLEGVFEPFIDDEMIEIFRIAPAISRKLLQSFPVK